MRFNFSRKLILSLVLLVVLGFGIGTIILLANPATVTFNPSNLGGREVREATIDLGDVTKITIVNSVGELNVELVDSEEIEVVYEAYKKSVLNINEGRNSIKIEGKVSERGSFTNINISNVPVSLNIKLPRSFSDKLEIKNGVGESVLKLGSYSSLDVDAGVGEMKIYLESLVEGTVVAEVGVGALQFNLPDGADVDLRANTGVGEITNRANFDTKETGSKFIAQSFKGYSGEGSARVTLKVGTGEIVIR